MPEIDNLISSISDNITAREEHVKHILINLLKDMLFPHPVSREAQNGRYALESMIHAVFRLTFINGPKGEEYPDIKITPQLDRFITTIKQTLTERIINVHNSNT